MLWECVWGMEWWETRLALFSLSLLATVNSEQKGKKDVPKPKPSIFNRHPQYPHHLQSCTQKTQRRELQRKKNIIQLYILFWFGWPWPGFALLFSELSSCSTKIKKYSLLACLSFLSKIFSQFHSARLLRHTTRRPRKSKYRIFSEQKNLFPLF